MSLMRAAKRVPALSDNTSAEAMNGNLGARRRSWSMTLPLAKCGHILPRMRLPRFENSALLNQLSLFGFPRVTLALSSLPPLVGARQAASTKISDFDGGIQVP